MNALGSDATIDFPIADIVSVRSAAELRELFEAHRADDPPLRLCGTATQQRAVPAPTRTPRVVSLAPLAGITRLEADDLTCSVEPGVRRADLDAALRERGLRLPCAPSGGTLGGLFALGRAAASEAPGPSSLLGVRALLLGLSGVLAEGRPFKAGARVVKSVAGFDLQKLFVGSRGQLFAATELHLKLRPLPRASVAFRRTFADPSEAVARFKALRLDDCPPAALRLSRQHGATSLVVAGTYEGPSRVISARLRLHELEEHPLDVEAAPPPPDAERITGLVAPSRVARILASLPARAGLTVNGTGGFEVWAAAEQTDGLLSDLADCGAVGELDFASPARRGRATLRDSGAATIEARLKAALDPGSILT